MVRNIRIFKYFVQVTTALVGGRFYFSAKLQVGRGVTADLCERFANIIYLGIVRIDLQYPFKVLSG